MEDIPLYVGKRRNILILSGGGIKGLAMLGALKCLIDNDIIVKPDIICGTSVGSIIGLYLAIGYTPQDIYNLLLELDFAHLLKPDFDNILNEICFGFNSTDNIIYIVKTLIEKKNISNKITFKELFDKFKIKLIITGTCLNDSTLHYFSVDNSPTMEILKAVRISISIPIFFKPYIYKNKIWIDGGCIEHYPITLFKDKLHDVIGVLLDDKNNNMESSDFDSIDKYIVKIIKCIAFGSIHNKYEIYLKNTIHIKCFNEETESWEIDNDYKIKMYNLGYDTANKFIKEN